ncbi:hypothetical protein GCM10027294_45820 [Marinactinospora endophytica]
MAGTEGWAGLPERALALRACGPPSTTTVPSGRGAPAERTARAPRTAPGSTRSPHPRPTDRPHEGGAGDHWGRDGAGRRAGRTNVPARIPADAAGKTGK